MIIGDYEIPEGFESMSCIYNCGFILVWSHKEGAGDVGSVMDNHIALTHIKPEMPLLHRFFLRKEKGKDERPEQMF